MKQPDAQAWYDRMRRCAQHNLNEHDPKTLDIDEWVDYWVSLKMNALVLSAGGFIAFYPTKLDNHHRSQFLGERDFFGDYLDAAKKKGIRVVARIETNWAHKEILKAQPDWFARDAKGDPVHHPETPWVYRTCMFSPYHSEQVLAIMREIGSLYDVDGFFTNSWPPFGKPRTCYCISCQGSSDRSRRDLYERSQSRILEICRHLNSVAAEKRKDRVYNINFGGGIRSVQSVLQMAEVGSWLTADHQGRMGDTPVWDCAQQGRVLYAIMKGRPVTNAVGSKSTIWRHAAKSSAEMKLWLAECAASGMVPWHIWMGGEVEDKRWQATGREFFRWLAKNETHFFNRRLLANLGVVWSQRLNGFYEPPSRLNYGYGASSTDPSPGQGDPTDHMQGLYYGLLEGRFLFDFVHEQDLGLEILGKYSALLLPNIAVMGETQCRQLEQYVRAGGSVLATFETSLYDEWGEPRSDFGLADLFGINRVDSEPRRVGRVFYSRIENDHEILSGFQDTEWLPGGEYRVPITSSGRPSSGRALLTVVPSYPQGIPEMVYHYSRAEQDYRSPGSREPAVVVSEKDQSRLIYLSGDICRSLWLFGNQDMSRLLQNSIRWILRGKSPVTVTGKDEMVELFAWETEPGYAVHILNYNNPNMTHADIRRFYPVGRQHVTMNLPEEVRINRIELLRAGTRVPYRAGTRVPNKQDGSTIEFVIPGVEDYEVAVLYR